MAAVLLKKAIGDRFHAVMVDNGCLRKDEAAKVFFYHKILISLLSLPHLL